MGYLSTMPPLSSVTLRAMALRMPSPPRFDQNGVLPLPEGPRHAVDLPGGGDALDEGRSG